MKNTKYDKEKNTLTNLDSEGMPYAEWLVEEIKSEDKKKK